MDTLSVNPVSPVAVGVLSTPRPVIQPLAVPPGQHAKAAGPAALSLQEVAQSLFQRTLQTATLYPVAEPASGSAGLALDATASLLAALNPPQATADTTATPAATTNPEAVQASNTSSSTAQTPTAPVASLPDLPATQDAFGASLSPDFAMQTALRFGAGVVTEAALAAVPATNLGTGLLRDATAVPRLGNLQPRAGGPGPEAFAQPGAATQRILRTYEAGSALSPAQGTSTVDLLA
jgi:hypothetical protein